MISRYWLGVVGACIACSRSGEAPIQPVPPRSTAVARGALTSSAPPIPWNKSPVVAATLTRPEKGPICKAFASHRPTGGGNQDSSVHELLWLNCVGETGLYHDLLGTWQETELPVLGAANDIGAVVDLLATPLLADTGVPHFLVTSSGLLFKGMGCFVDPGSPPQHRAISLGGKPLLGPRALAPWPTGIAVLDVAKGIVRIVTVDGNGNALGVHPIAWELEDGPLPRGMTTRADDAALLLVSEAAVFSVDSSPTPGGGATWKKAKRVTFAPQIAPTGAPGCCSVAWLGSPTGTGVIAVATQDAVLLFEDNTFQQVAWLPPTPSSDGPVAIRAVASTPTEGLLAVTEQIAAKVSYDRVEVWTWRTFGTPTGLGWLPVPLTSPGGTP